MSIRALGTMTGHSSHVNKVKFLPGYNRLFSLGFSGEVFEWDVKARKLQQNYKGHNSSVNDIQFLPKSKQFVTISNDGTIRQWDINKINDSKIIFEINEPIQSLFLADDAQTIYLSTKKFMLLKYDIKSRSILFKIKAVTNNLFIKVVSEKKNLAVIGGAGPTIYYVSLENGEVLFSKPFAGPACASFRFFTNEKNALLLTYTGELLQISDTLEKIKGFTPLKTIASSLALRPDEKTAAISMDHAIRLVDLNTFKESELINVPAKGNYSVAFSDDGKLLALGSADKTVRLWEMD